MKLRFPIIAAVALVAWWLFFRKPAAPAPGAPSDPPPAAPPPANLDRAAALPPGTPVDPSGLPYSPPFGKA